MKRKKQMKNDDTPSDQAFIRAAREIAKELCTEMERSGVLTPDEIANMAIFAMGEVAAKQLGRTRAIERIRDAADIFEKQILG
jgi:hypothetical protein